jgi:Raf kinase inhibitor-like YbhB/YbcL family protein
VAWQFQYGITTGKLASKTGKIICCLSRTEGTTMQAADLEYTTVRPGLRIGNPGQRKGEPNMRNKGMSALTAVAFLALSGFVSAEGRDEFRLSSTAFEDGTTMPLSTIYNYLYNGANVCSIDGSAGGDESPQLSWKNAPRGTRTFALIVFDETAGVVHWGMYNIQGTTRELPQNAGVTGSAYGQQVINTYGSAGSNADLNYGGPCPPAGYPPNLHRYVFTIYALDTELRLGGSADFPPTALSLSEKLVASRDHILASASITGLYSTTPTE